MGSLSERLKSAAGGGLRMADFDGQTVTVVSIEKEPSPFDKTKTSVRATIIDAEGNEVSFYVTPTSASQLIEVEDELPLELRVVSFPGQFGKTGYLFEEVV